MKGEPGRNSLVFVVSLAIPLLAWAVLSLRIGTETILPGPLRVLRGTVVLLTTPSFLRDIGVTTLRAGAVLLSAAAISIPTGLGAGQVPLLGTFLAPIVTVLRTIPVIAVILLALIWFRSGMIPVFVGVLMVAPVLYDAARGGSVECPVELLEMGRVYHVPRFQKFRHIVIPSALPAIFSGLRSAHGIAWKVTVAAEVLSVPGFGIGSQMQEARLYLFTEQVLAWTVVLVVLSSLGDRLIGWTEKGFRKRRGLV